MCWNEIKWLRIKRNIIQNEKVKDKKGKFPPWSGERRERRRRSSTTIYLSFKLCLVSSCALAFPFDVSERYSRFLPFFTSRSRTVKAQKYDEKRQQYITVATVLYSSDPVTLTHRHKNKKQQKTNLLFFFLSFA